MDWEGYIKALRQISIISWKHFFENWSIIPVADPFVT